MTKEELIRLKEDIAALSEEDIKERDLYLRGLSNGDIQGPPVGYPSIDKPWLKYYSEEDISIDIPNKSPYDIFKETAMKLRDEVALTYIPKEGMEINITFEEELKKIDEIAKALMELGVKKDEIILTVLPNFPESKELLFSSMKIGIPFYPVNPLLPVSVLNDILEKNNIKNVFIFDGFLDKYERALNNNVHNLNNIITVSGTDSLPFLIKKVINSKNKVSFSKSHKANDKFMTFDKFIKLSKKYNGDIDSVYGYNDDDIALIVGTSGTTSIPKGVCLTGKNINCTVYEQLNGAIDHEVGDKYLDIMNNSLAYGAIAAICSSIGGLRAYFVPGFTMDVYDDVISKDIDLMVGGPVHCERLKKHKLNGENIPVIKNWISGGAPLSKETERILNSIEDDTQIDEDKVVIRQGYGATENEGVISYQKKGAYKFGGMGIPLTKENVGVFDPITREELQYGQIGELAINGDSVMKEYLNNPEETQKVLINHPDNSIWLHMKDLGYIDTEGQLFFADRIKNMFARNGMNVHPNSISEFIKTIPNVEDCAVTGVEHPDEQNVPVAFIKLENSEVDLENEMKKINDYCYGGLEESSIPYEIFFVENIPLNAGGKADIKYLLEKMEVNYFNKQAKAKKLTIEKINPLNI